MSLACSSFGFQCALTSHHIVALAQGKNNPKSWLEGLSLVTPSCEQPNNSHLNLKCECCCVLDHWQDVKLHSQPSSWQESRRKCAREALSLGRKVWRLDSTRAAKGKALMVYKFPPRTQLSYLERFTGSKKSEAAVYRLLIGDRVSQSKQFFIHFVEILWKPENPKSHKKQINVSLEKQIFSR